MMSTATFRSKVKLILGTCLISLAFYTYLLYQSGGGTAFYLPPLGLSLFATGFWIGFAKTDIYRKFGAIFPFIIGAVFMTWMAWDTGLHDYIVNSPYGSALAGIARNVAVYVLDMTGIHASNVGNQIILPAGSKVQSFDVVNSCSGADTTILFLGAFSLMLLDIRRRSVSSKKIAVCFVLGGLGIYLTAIMRIPLLGMVGYYFGYDTMETFHMYSGYLIFLASVAIFWWLSLRWIGKKELEKETIFRS
ncbi:MAG: archaeosortase/exosortase family protein [Nitrosotalea sp.]